MAERRTHTMVTGLACRAPHVKRSRVRSNKCEIVRRMFESRGPSAQDEKLARNSGGAERSRRRVRVLFGLGAVGVAALLATAWFSISTRDSERALPGVHVEGQDVSRLTRGQIAARVKAWANERGARKEALSLAGTALFFQPQSVGFRVDAEACAARALAVGRSGGFF